MTRKEFIDYLVDKGVPFKEANIEGYDGIYIYSRKEYELKKRHPIKYINLYIPYLRVSNFEGDWYTKRDGWTCYMPECNVLDIVNELAA